MSDNGTKAVAERLIHEFERDIHTYADGETFTKDVLLVARAAREATAELARLRVALSDLRDSYRQQATYVKGTVGDVYDRTANDLEDLLWPDAALAAPAIQASAERDAVASTNARLREAITLYLEGWDLYFTTVGDDVPLRKMDEARHLMRAALAGGPAAEQREQIVREAWRFWASIQGDPQVLDRGYRLIRVHPDRYAAFDALFRPSATPPQDPAPERSTS